MAIDFHAEVGYRAAKDLPIGRFRHRRAAFAFFVAASLLAPSIATAQVNSPSQVTPSNLRPAAAPSGAITLSNAAGLTAPPGAQNLSVTLSNVSVSGGFAELQVETGAITVGLRGRKVSVADIFAAANAIERAYAARGYVLVRVAVPPQKLQNGGTLRLVVIDGFVESIDVGGVPEKQRALVTARMASLIGQRHVTLGEIERRLILASDVPGMTLSSTIMRGATPGGTRLVLEATQSAVVGSAGVDNRLPSSLGNFALNGSVAFNSVFGWGEQVYGAASSSYNLGKVLNATTPMQLLGGGIVLPIGVDGFKINPEYTNSITRPIPFAGAPPEAGYYQRFDLRASYPLILSRTQALTVEATYEWDQEHLVPIGFDRNLYFDQYSVARFQLEDHLRMPFGALLEGTLVFSQGLGGRGEAQAAASGVPLSQQGASSTFSKLGLDARWLQALPDDFLATLIGQAQTSFGQPLFLAEQFSLDGPQAASGYPLGTFTVDEGATLRGEIQRSFPLPLAGGRTSVAPYIFGAASRGWIDQPTAVEQGQISAGSFGVGIRLGADVLSAPLGGTFSIELARGLSNVVGEGQVYRCNVAFAAKF